MDKGGAELCLRRLRRHGALLLGSKAAADKRIGQTLTELPGVSLERMQNEIKVLFWGFHQLDPSLAANDLISEDFAKADQAMVSALHKISMTDRALLLLRVTEGFDDSATAFILGLPILEVKTRVARARMLLQASLVGRLCMIVEDDLIAMRDLQAEVVQGGLSIGGAAKNLTEAIGLVDQIRPDIGIIDLALPEGTLAGAEIATRLRERFGSRIVFVTAFEKQARDIAKPDDSIVSKPWSRATLSKAIAGAAA